MFTVRPVRKNGAPAGKSRGAAVSKPGSEADLDNGTTSGGASAEAAPVEVWLPIPGAPPYEASNLGRVRSSHYPGPPRVLRPALINGYPALNLRINKRSRMVGVHILVCEAFHGPRPPGQEVRHLNGVRTDARVENLAWGTKSQNRQDAVAHGTHYSHGRTKTHCTRGGHALSGDNVRFTKAGSRYCRTCKTEQHREYRAQGRTS